MPRDVVADHSSKNSSYNADTSRCLVHILLMINIIHRHFWSSNFNIIDLLFLLSSPLVFLHCRRYCKAANYFDSTQSLHLTGLQTRKTELNSPRCKHISNYFTQISSLTLFIINPHNLTIFCVILVNPIFICKLSQ